MASKVAIIIGSTRTPRVGPHVANYIKSLIESHNTTDSPSYHLVDVADFNLPVFDELILPAMVPAHGVLTKPHALAWSKEINQYAGFIFISAEYNFGVPSAMKNAIDFLYHEIIGKPAVIITYGIFGGESANEGLRKTLEGMKLRVVDGKIALPFKGNRGPDLYAAVGGSLGEDTKTWWSEEYKGAILKAVKELELKLKEPPVVATE